MRTDRAVIRISSDRVANKDEQWLSSHEADCEQNDRQTPVKTLPSLAVGNKQCKKITTSPNSNSTEKFYL